MATRSTQPDRALEMVAYMLLSAQQGGWAMTGVPEAPTALARISGGGDRHAYIRAVVDAAQSLLNGDGVLAGERFDDALAIEGGSRATRSWRR